MCSDVVLFFMLGCVPACFLECYFLNHSEKKMKNKYLSVFVICLTVVVTAMTKLITDDEFYLIYVIGFLFPIFMAALINVFFKR